MEAVSDKGETLQFTSNIEVSAGCHILYTYLEENRYIENAAAFLAEGIDKKQVVIFNDTSEHIAIVKAKLLKAGYLLEQLNEITFVDSDAFYNGEANFKVDHVYNDFRELIKPNIEENKTLRTWGRIIWDSKSENTIENLLYSYESCCDCLITARRNLISVCAYSCLAMPSSFLVNMLSVHEYHMTDETFAPSHLYHKKPVIFPSISEQVKLEKAAFNQLIQSEKLTVAGQLAAGIAHEIRNPIAAIKGFLTLLNSDEKGKQYIRIINDEVEKIELISSEFLALAKPHIEDKKEVNMFQLMVNVKTLLEPQALGKSIGIHFLHTVGQKDVIITCDEVKIRQVLINIIKNAIEAMENGFITLGIYEKDKQVHISIADEGPGMPKEIIDKLGQAFFTTKENGNGLGLLVCHKIIGDHNGQLVVESEEGKGTVFTIKLPKN